MQLLYLQMCAYQCWLSAAEHALSIVVEVLEIGTPLTCCYAFVLLLLLLFTEAGEGEDGRMKSAIGIGALLMDGLGDTIRVSLTEDPEYEMDPCRRLANLGQTACAEVRRD